MPEYEGWTAVKANGRHQFIDNERLDAWLAANPGAKVGHEIADRELPEDGPPLARKPRQRDLIDHLTLPGRWFRWFMWIGLATCALAIAYRLYEYAAALLA